MAKAYALMGYVEDDEFFDIENIVKQRRRRYSIRDLVANKLIDNDDKQVKYHVKTWKNMIKKKYEIGTGYNKGVTHLSK